MIKKYNSQCVGDAKCFKHLIGYTREQKAHIMSPFFPSTEKNKKKIYWTYKYKNQNLYCIKLIGLY